MSLNLLVISHTAHVQREGKYYGWGPTVAELNFLTTKFDQIVHIAPVVNNEKADMPASFSEVNKGIRMVPVLNRGGTSWKAKLIVLWDSFHYLTVIWKELKCGPDLIHVRCPANISFIALIVLLVFPRKRKWIKYAGDWKPQNDFLSYKLQRFIIRNLLSNHFATVNGHFPDEKKFIHYFLNPSFTLDEVRQASGFAEVKELRTDGFRMIFVGSLERNKGADIALRAFRLLTRHHAGEFTVIGDGSEAINLQKLAIDLELKNTVRFVGWKSRSEIKDYYAKAHFIILPSQGEGWPKVISEGMAYGVIPIVSDVSNLKSLLEAGRIGKVIPEYSAQSYADAVHAYLKNHQEWQLESSRATNFAREFSFEIWWGKLNNHILSDIQKKT